MKWHGSYLGNKHHVSASYSQIQWTINFIFSESWDYIYYAKC